MTSTQGSKFIAVVCSVLVLFSCRVFDMALWPEAEETPLPTIGQPTQSPATTVVAPATDTLPAPSSTPRPSATARPASATPEPAADLPTLAPIDLEDPEVIYAEDFNGGGASLAWNLETSDTEYATVERSLEDSAYRWQVRAKQDMFTMVQADQPTEPPSPHFIYSVKTRLQNAPEYIAYGLLFYVQDADNLFYIKVTQAGKYRLYMMQNDEWEPVTDAATSKDLRTGPNAENWLALERRADWMAFFINGVQQDEWTLGDYPGGFGLAVELDAGDSATIFWDDVTISE